MSSRNPVRAFACVVLLLGGGSRLAAESPVLFTNLNYESPSLVAPILVLIKPTSSGHEWRAGILGWVLAGQWVGRTSPTTELVIAAELTPFNSHSSDYIYRDGARDRSLSYRNRTIEVKAGIDKQHSSSWFSEFRLVGLYESVADLDDRTVEEFWDQPFVGVEIVSRFEDIVSDDPYQSLWDGVKASVHLEAFGGSEAWWRSRFFIGVGKRLGRVFVSARGSWLYGEELNTVNRFLVGGSWEIAGMDYLHGYRYGEFRLQRAVVANGGLDVQMVGDWTVGFRASYLSSPSRTTYGAAVKISKIWNGIGLNVGIGLPKDIVTGGESSRAVVFAGATVGLFEPW